MRILLIVILPLALVGSPACAASGSVDQAMDVRGVHSSKVMRKHKLRDDVAAQKAQKAQRAGSQSPMPKRSLAPGESEGARAWREADI